MGGRGIFLLHFVHFHDYSERVFEQRSGLEGGVFCADNWVLADFVHNWGLGKTSPGCQELRGAESERENERENREITEKKRRERKRKRKRGSRGLILQLVIIHI